MLQTSHTHAEPLLQQRAGKQSRVSTFLFWGASVVVALLILLAVAAYFVDEPLRRYMEGKLNAELEGYTVRLPELVVHPLGFSLTLRNLTIAQKAHPHPPVAQFPALDASVHWRALVHGRLVADFLLTHPRVHVNRPQLQHEVADPVPLKDKGWQQALETIYPLKINRLRIDNGDLTYIDDDPDRPLHVGQLTLLADNIRNVRSPDQVYPSDVHVSGIIFDTGTLRAHGKANFLAEPFAAVDVDIAARAVNLTYFKPMLARMNLSISDGALSAKGHVEYGPRTQTVHLQQLTIRSVRLDYVHTSQTADEERARAVELEHAAQQLTQKPVVLVRVDRLHITDSTVGYVDRSSDPSYRVFLANSDLTLSKLSNQARDGPAHLDLKGQFMGSGESQVSATVQPAATNADVDVSVMIEGTALRAMNDILRAFANFDVTSGEFSLYSQLTIKKGEISGYLKPIFAGVQVYDRRQDAQKPVLHQVYEELVGVLEVALRNAKGEVGTKVDISGRASDPQSSTWEIVAGLLKNAFIKAISHGFEPANGQPPQP